MYDLQVEFLSDWAITSGQGAGAYADIVTLKDENSLPYVPGKSLKGIARNAFQQAIDNNWFPERNNWTEVLFGTEGANGETTQGALQFSSAELSGEEKRYFQVERKQVKFLYRTIHFTKINEETGTAENGSLRAMEVVVPLTLRAELGLNKSVLAQHEVKEVEAIDALSKALTLVTEMGAKRTRGFGQVAITIAEQGGK